MTFLEELTAHKGGLILLKTNLFWYGGRGWDGVQDRVCLLMDAEVYAEAAMIAAATPTAARVPAAALLLIDGCPHWVWVGADDVELL
jgi:hypothetical protein